MDPLGGLEEILYEGTLVKPIAFIVAACVGFDVGVLVFKFFHWYVHIVGNTLRGFECDPGSDLTTTH